jgi:hypothetical protein
MLLATLGNRAVVRIALPTEIDVRRSRHDPVFRQELLVAQLAQLARELDQARVTTPAGAERIEHMRAEAKLAIELATVLGRIQQHLRKQENLGQAA